MPVLPKWVTQVAAALLAAAGIIEGIRATITSVGVPIPEDIVLYVALGAGVLGVLGKALGDDDGDGIPNVIDQ